MKNLLMLAFAIAALGAGSLRAQSKKEVIEKFTHEADSLKKALASKSTAVQQQEIKIAKLEGTVEANNQTIKRLESRSDSLNKVSLSKTDAIIDSLKADISKLKIVFEYFKSEGRTMTAKNEMLQRELAAIKQKLGITDTLAQEAKLVKEASVTEAPKAIVEIAAPETKIAKEGSATGETTAVKDNKVIQEAKVTEQAKATDVPTTPVTTPSAKSERTEPK